MTWEDKKDWGEDKEWEVDWKNKSWDKDWKNKTWEDKKDWDGDKDWKNKTWADKELDEDKEWEDKEWDEDEDQLIDLDETTPEKPTPEAEETEADLEGEEETEGGRRLNALIV